jgi:hypothetical protein
MKKMMYLDKSEAIEYVREYQKERLQSNFTFCLLQAFKDMGRTLDLKKLQK